MTNLIGGALLVFMLIALMIIGVAYPSLLSDCNIFLKSFVTHEYLGVLGMIVAITTASASSIHIELRRLEAEYRHQNAFEKTRKEVRRAASALIYLFCGGFIIVFLKPNFIEYERYQIFFNSAAVFVLFWNVLILIALLRLAFMVGPITFSDDD